MILDLSAPADWVPIAEVREFCSASADQDTTIEPLMKAGRLFIENYTCIRFGSRDVEIRLPRFVAATIGVGLSPLTAITAIDYVDEDGAAQVFTDYSASLEAGVIWVTNGDPWPSTSLSHPIPVSIKANGGHATAPEDVQLALKMFVLAHWDDLDQDAAIKALLAPYVWR